MHWSDLHSYYRVLHFFRRRYIRTTSEKTGTTTGKGAPGQVKISVGATNSNPFVANRSGYNDFSVVK